MCSNFFFTKFFRNISHSKKKERYDIINVCRSSTTRYSSQTNKIVSFWPDFQIYIYIYIIIGARGGVVVKALRYKPAGRGFDSRWRHWNFSVT